MDNIFSAIKQAGGSALIVGGFVRDTLLNLTPKDRDVEVYGLTPDRLLSILSNFGEVDSVGKSFGILKLNYQGEILDFSLPRRENKSGAGHKGFDVSVDPFMSVKEAASRRDLTINSLAMTPNGDILDYFGGVRDLQAQILRHTSPAFSEDSLRVLRVMQFASRFGFSVDPDTISLCKGLSPADLPAERIAEEFRKWSLGIKPSLGLQFLVDSGWINYWPVLADMIGCEQDSGYHPEGWDFSVSMPSHSFGTSMAESTRVNITFRDLISKSFTTNTVGKVTFETFSPNENFASFYTTLGTSRFSFNVNSSLRVTLTTSPQSFMSTFDTTITTDKSLRVVFSIPNSSMNRIVQRAVDDNEILQSIISPISIYMMNVLRPQQLSTQMQLHNQSVDPLVSLNQGGESLHVSANIINLTLCSIDDNIISVCCDITFNPKIDHNYLLEDFTPQVVIKQGDVFTHTKCVCDEAATIARREAFSKEDTFLLVISALLHDVGKPATTFVKNGRIVSPGHDVVGEGLSRTFCEQLKFSQSNTDIISSLVRVHMYHCGGVSSRKARRLVHKFKIPYSLLWLLIEADHSGRPPLPKGLPVKAEQLKSLVEVELNRAKGPLVLGRHLIERGYEAGPSLGIKLKELYNLQVEEGLDFNQLMERV